MLPFNWSQDFAYYVTYFGDVYYGLAVEADFNSDDFYIVGKNQFREYQSLAGERFKRASLEKVGIHIPAQEIILKRLSEHEVSSAPQTSPPIQWRGNSTDYKKMYVFGAGASTHCQFGDGAKLLKDSPLRPPLGPELFSARFNSLVMKYPGLKMILPKFEARGNDIEAILEDDWSDLMKRLDKELAAQHIQLQFFLRELFQVISGEVDTKFFRHSLHTLFVQKLLKQWKPDNRPAIVSFNYDTILEHALEKQMRVQFNDINRYVDQGENTQFIFFKPHGSWNWGWEFEKEKIKNVYNDVPGWLYKNSVTPAQVYYGLLGDGMLTTHGWGVEAGHHANHIGKLTPNRDKIKVMASGSHYFPALLLPYRDKDEFVMPYNQQMQMEHTMPWIEELVLIGWKGNENLFNTKLKKQVQRLRKITIANPDVEGVKKELGNYLDLSKYAIQAVKSFEDYVLNHMN